MPCSKVSINKNYKCNKAECICIPTGGKSCICICENENGDIMRCDACKCSDSDTCQCSCDHSRCTCIVTNGVDCVCVCRDGRGNIKSCDCSCVEAESSNCCKKELTFKSRECCNKEPEESACGRNSKCDEICNFEVTRHGVTASKSYKCDKAGCVCIPSGKTCLCVCENENGDIIRCNDCKCNNSDTCQCKRDDSKCTCIITKRANCICVCHDERGNIKACDCSCIETRDAKCCKKELTFKSCDCRSEKPKTEVSGGSCKRDGKEDFKESRCNVQACFCSCIESKYARCCYKDANVKPYGCYSKEEEREAESRRPEIISKSYKCDKAGCTYLPPGGKSCICACENDRGSDNCKCCSEKYCFMKQTCNNHETLRKRNRGQYCRCVDNMDEYKSNCCSCNSKEATCMCCGKYTSEIKTCVNNTKAIEFQGCCTSNEKSCGCCKEKIQEDRKVDAKQGCVCISKETRYSRVANDGCICVTKKNPKSCNCCY